MWIIEVQQHGIESGHTHKSFSVLLKNNHYDHFTDDIMYICIGIVY